MQIDINETKILQGFGFTAFFLLFYIMIFPKSKMFAVIQVLCSTVEKCTAQREA